jgi:hypothetical protein
MSTERLTRAHRRKLEKEAHVKLDLDNLANIDIQHLEEDLYPNHKSTPDSQEDSQEGDKESDDAKYDIGEESELSSVLDSENDQDESSSDDSDSSEEESDDDLEELLLKAQKALKENNDVIGLENAAKPKYSLPKLNPGISVQNELYIKKTKAKPAKLVDSAVEFVTSNEKPSNKKASLIVVANKDQEQRVSKKERQAVSLSFCLAVYILTNVIGARKDNRQRMV